MSRVWGGASMPLTCGCMLARMPFVRRNARDHIMRPARIRPLPGIIISLKMLGGRLVPVVDMHRNMHWLYGIVRWKMTRLDVVR
jgi:hypothetical protein